ncbi:MAG: FmdB family zinc ribbon protein [Burkholderiaceae bacterium]
MPIYAYRCESCGHEKDVIQKFSDTPLSICPSCGADAFRKQLTAPSFQLKGSGWYVTDFRDNGKKAAKPDAGEKSGGSPSGDSAAPDTPSGGSASEGKADAKPSGATAAPAPAASKPADSATPAAPPAPKPTSGT